MRLRCRHVHAMRCFLAAVLAYVKAFCYIPNPNPAIIMARATANGTKAIFILSPRCFVRCHFFVCDFKLIFILAFCMLFRFVNTFISYFICTQNRKHYYLALKHWRRPGCRLRCVVVPVAGCGNPWCFIPCNQFDGCNRWCVRCGWWWTKYPHPHPHPPLSVCFMPEPEAVCGVCPAVR